MKKSRFSEEQIVGVADRLDHQFSLPPVFLWQATTHSGKLLCKARQLLCGSISFCNSSVRPPSCL